VGADWGAGEGGAPSRWRVAVAFGGRRHVRGAPSRWRGACALGGRRRGWECRCRRGVGAGPNH
jgi:hypothetical protein